MRATEPVPFAFIGLLVATCAALPARAETMLVTPLVAPGVDPAERVLLDEALRANIAALDFMPLVGRADSTAAAAALPCDGALACSVARGQRAGAFAVVVAELKADAASVPGVTVALSLIDVAAALERNRVEVQAPDARRALRVASIRLLAPDRYVGRVRVEIEDAGAASGAGADAEVLIDGAQIARTPMLAAAAVTPARHELEVRAPGAAPWRTFVDVPFDEVVTVVLKRSGGELVRVAPGAAAVGAASTPGGAAADATATAVAPAAETAGPAPLLVAGVASAALGGVSLIGGGVLTGVALDLKARWDAGEGTADDVRTNQMLVPVSRVLFGVGALAAVAGVGFIVAHVVGEAPADAARDAAPATGTDASAAAQ